MVAGAATGSRALKKLLELGNGEAGVANDRKAGSLKRAHGTLVVDTRYAGHA